jgi:hypothetical protein
MISKSKSSKKEIFRLLLWIFIKLMLLLYVLTNYVELGPQVDSII